jgi:hypothetical protein
VGFYAGHVTSAGSPFGPLVEDIICSLDNTWNSCHNIEEFVVVGFSIRI